MDEQSAKLAFKLAPFAVLLMAGVILLVFASTTIVAEGETKFYLPLGVPGILATLASVIGIYLVALTK